MSAGSTKVYAVILDPQGSMGGFDWFLDEQDANKWADNLGRDLILGVAPVHVEGGAGLTTEEITDEIDSRLLEIEERLGYTPC